MTVPQDVRVASIGLRSIIHQVYGSDSEVPLHKLQRNGVAEIQLSDKWALDLDFRQCPFANRRPMATLIRVASNGRRIRRQHWSAGDRVGLLKAVSESMRAEGWAQ